MHPAKVNRLIAAYDRRGWQPAFTAVIPQMTVEMIVAIPFAEDYRNLAPKSRRLSGARQEADRAREGADGVGVGRQGAQDPRARHYG